MYAHQLSFQLIFSVFKTLTDQTVTVELKNDLSITGVLKSVDQCVLTASSGMPTRTSAQTTVLQILKHSVGFDQGAG